MKKYHLEKLAKLASHDYVLIRKTKIVTVKVGGRCSTSVMYFGKSIEDAIDKAYRKIFPKIEFKDPYQPQ